MEPFYCKNGLFDGENELCLGFVEGAGQLCNLSQANHLQLAKEEQE